MLTSTKKSKLGKKIAQVFLGLGSNLGDSQVNLKVALTRLRAHAEIKIKKVSSLYRTKPIGGVVQPYFLNAVALITTTLDIHILHQFCKKLEFQAGRRFRQHNGPRELDIDLLLCDDIIIDKPELKIPHPRLKERGFVLWPLSEIAAELKPPLIDESITSLAKKTVAQEVELMASSPVWWNAVDK